MLSECKTTRAELLGADPEALRSCAHLAVCAECARWVGGLARRETALSQLPRLSAPFALDGGVVQALEAGFRQDRAVRALSRLERAGSPPELSRALDRELSSPDGAWSGEGERSESLPAPRRLRAPARLADRIAEELGDPAGHRARRFVGSLPRLAAPEALAERLAGETWHTSRRRLRVPAALAGAGLALAAVVITLQLRRTPERSAWTYSFVVEDVDDPAQMSQLGVSLADGVSGGLFSARGL